MTRQKNDILKIVLSVVGGISVGAALIGLPKCTELKTAVAAKEDHLRIQKQIESLDEQNREEHRDFRRAISDNMREILRRLPEKK